MTDKDPAPGWFINLGAGLFLIFMASIFTISVIWLAKQAL